VTRGLSFSVDTDGAKIRMRGIVATREESNGAARVVMAVPGVMSVKNELRVTAEIRSPMGE
jgi:osmotically-inducible protein OsmY